MRAASSGAARRAALAALGWSHALLLLFTGVVLARVWTGSNLRPVHALTLLLLSALGLWSSLLLRRRLQLTSLALERAQRTSTVGLLTAGFAHEMKNALTVVLGFAELARTAGERSRPPPEERVLRHLQEAEAETRRTIGQLHGFLGYAGGEPLSRTPQDLNELVRDALTLIRPMARMKELRVVEEPGSPPRVECDPFAVRQLLLNLLLNALDFARTRVVVATARGPDGAAEVTVRDDGPGVPPADRERIFQRFATTRPGGNGLGLSSSREIAQAHGGTLSLLATDRGAAFLARFPAGPC